MNETEKIYAGLPKKSIDDANRNEQFENAVETFWNYLKI